MDGWIRFRTPRRGAKFRRAPLFAQTNPFWKAAGERDSEDDATSFFLLTEIEGAKMTYIIAIGEDEKPARVSYVGEVDETEASLSLNTRLTINASQNLYQARRDGEVDLLTHQKRYSTGSPGHRVFQNLKEGRT